MCIKMPCLLFILVSCCCTHLVTSRIASKAYTCTCGINNVCVIILCTVIIQHPLNQSVCEGETVNFTCVIMFPDGSSSFGGAFWVDDNNNLITSTPPRVITTDDSNGRSAPANVTNMLTVTNVSISDNGSVYICSRLVDGVYVIRSDPSILTILGKQLYKFNDVHTPTYLQ